VSPVLVYALCCTLYLSATVLVSMIRIARAPPKREPISVTMLFAGFSYVLNNRLVLGAIALDLFAVILGGATALLPVFARDVFHAGPWGLGLLRASPGAGALIVALVMTRWPPRRHVGRIVFAAVATFGLSIVVFSLSTSLVLSMLALAVLGGSDMISVVIRQTLIQLETPDGTRGRVSAVNSLFVQASNQLGEFRAGVMAAWLGAIPAVLIGGIGALLVVLVGRKAFSELYFADTLESTRR
jgi:MFS family permease